MEVLAETPYEDTAAVLVHLRGGELQGFVVPEVDVGNRMVPQMKEDQAGPALAERGIFWERYAGGWPRLTRAEQAWRWPAWLREVR